jgi:hypothetical protein
MEKIKNIKLPNGEVYELGGGLDDKITNCITEIPQRIKYELKDGNLILKAGSQFIIPNGFEADGTTRKFDYHTLKNDVTLLASYVNDTQYYVYNTVTGGFDYMGVTYSGSEHHTTSHGLSYNTKTNNVKIYSGANTVYSDKVSFPFVKVTSNRTVITVNEVFNGFGYIGSTVWVDKGVKGLIPNGRNEDGTCKNVEFTTSNVITGNYTTGVNAKLTIAINNSVIGFGYYYLDDKSNVIKATTDANLRQLCIIADVSVTSSNNITSFNPKQPFRAVDYNELTPTIPDYSAMVQANGTGWIQVAKDSFVMSYGVDAYAEDYWVYVTKDGSAVYPVGKRADDQDKFTQHTSFTFFVPAGWSFINTAENAYAYIYPLKGAK